MEIIKYPDERLRQKSEPVRAFDRKLHSVLDEMARTMYGARGVGLAGAQVGFFYRVFIVDIGSQDERFEKLFEFINPEITWRDGKTSWEEGCLSLPGYTETVNRAARITIRYQDRLGQPQVMEADELLGVALQHENDHLDGVLFIDRLSPLKRRFLKRKLEKGLEL
ncbi:MAG: peptide deformylase [Deltaproteobacteria bacterium]|nr:peptide deformylase [Deltaproteobacteria bacterium]MBI3293189.1 peptide deformylase [Deltaproteobacteria bacterium]